MTAPATPDLDNALAERDFVRALARSLLVDRGSADDIEQRTWLRAMQHGSAVARWRQWLSRVCRNLVQDQRRDEMRRDVHERRAARPEALTATDDLVAAEESRRGVIESVRSLPEPYRSTLWKRYWDDRSPTEIARELGVPSATVRSHLHRGHAMLRERLDRRYGDRRAWVALLAPLASSPIGIMLMSTKSKALAAAAAIVIAGLLIWGITPPSQEPGTPTETSTPPSAVVSSIPESTEPTDDPDLPTERSARAVARGVTVHVVARRDGVPVPGLALALESFPGFGAHGAALATRSGRTDRDGTLEFSLEPSDDARTVRLVSGDPRQELRTQPVVIAAGDVEATVHATVTSLECELSGEVHDALGAPIAGAIVSYSDHHQVTTDAAGRYSIAVPRGRKLVFVHAWADGYGRKTEQPTIPAHADSWQINFALLPGEQVEGRVVNESGDPVEGAKINTSMQLYSDVRTAADGSFALRSLEPGIALSVWAIKSGYRSGRTSWRKGIEEIEIVLQRGLALDGRVLDEDAVPIVGARVQVYDERSFGGVEAQFTDEEGRFRTDGLSAGTMTVVAHKRGYTKVTKSVHVDGENTVEIRLAEGQSVVGRVVDTAGSPIAGVRVSAMRGTGNSREFVGTGTETDAEGRFELTDLPNLPCKVSAYETGYRSASIPDVVPDGTEIELRMERSPTVTGRVLDGRTGKPIPEFTIKISDRENVNGYWVNPQRFDTEDGRWSIQPRTIRKETKVWVGVEAKGYAPATGNATARVEPVEDECIVSLQPGIEVRGTVRLLGTGTSVPGATIRLLGEDEHTSILDHSHYPTATSDAEGSFRFDSIGPGQTRVAIIHPDYPDRMQGPFDLRDGTTLDLRVAPAVSLRGQIVGFDDAAKFDVELIRYEDGRIVGRAEDTTEREFEFDGLGPGTHYIEFQAGATHRYWFVEIGTTDKFDVVLREREGDASVEVAVEGLTTGRVQLRPAADARTPGSPGIRNRTLVDGSFTFVGVANGKYKVRIYDDAHEKRAEQVFEVSGTGATRIDLTVD